MRTIRTLCGAVLLVALVSGCGTGSPPTYVLPPLSAVDIAVSADTLGVASSVQLSAIARDLMNQPVNSATFAWTSSDPAVATVNSGGLVTAAGEGNAFVYAAAGGLRDSASILVVPTVGGWILQASGSSRQLNGVFFQPDGHDGCAVGDGGEILTTADAGVLWTKRISNTSFNLNAVWFTSSTVGWAVGGNGTVLRTLDGGVTWSGVTSGASENLTGVYFATPDTGWVVGANGVVLRTFDPSLAAPWTKQNPVGANLNAVGFAGTRDGWAVGNGGTIIGTHDRGLTWFTASPAVTASNLLGVWRSTRFSAFAAGAAGAAPRTVETPDSTAWELQSAGAGNNLMGVMFPDSTHGWAVGENGTGLVVSTLNGGASWTPQTAPVSGTLRGVYFLDRLRGWAVGDNGRILHTGSGGN